MIRYRVERYGPWLAAVAVSIGFILLILSGIYMVRQQRQVDHKLCQQTVSNREATRATWDAARGLILRGQPSTEQRDATNRFFDSILETIPPLECVDNKPAVKEE